MVEWSRLVVSVPKVDVVWKIAVTLRLRGVGVVFPSGGCVATGQISVVPSMKFLFRGGVVGMSLVHLVLFPFRGFVFVLELNDGSHWQIGAVAQVLQAGEG